MTDNEQTDMIDEYNHIARAARAHNVVWETIEQQQTEIERLRNAITVWADAWDAADRGEERDDGVGVYKYAERQEVALRKAVGR